MDKGIQREGLRLCLQLRDKLDEIHRFFDDRTKEIERLSSPEKAKRQTPQKHLYVSMEEHEYSKNV